MCTCYRDTSLVAARHDSQHDRAFDRGDALLSRCDQLGIILFDSRRVDDQLRAFDVLGTVTHVDRDPVAADAVERFALVGVGTGKDEAFAVQDLCQRTHSRAADADEMDAFDII